MSVLTLNVDEVMRTLSAESSNPFVVHDKEVDIVRFAINSGFADIVLDGQVALRVMYQRPGETEVRAQTLTYYDTDGLHNYYDWQLAQSDLAKNGSLTVALCILRMSGSTVEEWHTTPCAVKVLGTIHTDDSDEADETITPTVAQRVAVLESVIRGMAGGAPIVVSSVAAMTDTSRLYVLKTNGYWYYYDGTAWEVGGIYGGIPTDKTLTQPEMAADAKVVGDKIQILGVFGYSDKKYSGLVGDAEKIEVYGNTFTSDTVKLCDSAQAVYDSSRMSTITKSGVTYSGDGDYLLINGTATGNYNDIWFASSSQPLKIPDELLGKSVVMRFRSDKPCTVMEHESDTNKNMCFQLTKYSAPGGSSANIGLTSRIVTSNEKIDSAITFTADANYPYVFCVARYQTKNSVFDNVRVLITITDASATVIDTEETLANGESAEFDIPSGFTYLSSGVHQYAVYELLNTQDYISQQVQSAYFGTVNDMRYADLEIGDTVRTLGYWNENDGGGSEYNIRTKSSSDVDDGGSIIICGDVVAELVIEHSGVIDVRKFGAKGDNSADDTIAFTNALAYAKSVYVPEGTYKISSPLVIGSHQTVELNPDAIIKPVGNNGLFILRSDAMLCGKGQLYTDEIGANYSSSVILITNNTNTDLQHTVVRDVVINGRQGYGTGIEFYSNLSQILYCTIDNVKTYGLQTALYSHNGQYTTSALNIWLIANFAHCALRGAYSACKIYLTGECGRQNDFSDYCVDAWFMYCEIHNAIIDIGNPGHIPYGVRLQEYSHHNIVTGISQEGTVVDFGLGNFIPFNYPENKSRTGPRIRNWLWNNALHKITDRCTVDVTLTNCTVSEDAYSETFSASKFVDTISVLNPKHIWRFTSVDDTQQSSVQIDIYDINIFPTGFAYEWPQFIGYNATSAFNHFELYGRKTSEDEYVLLGEKNFTRRFMMTNEVGPGIYFENDVANMVKGERYKDIRFVLKFEKEEGINTTAAWISALSVVGLQDDEHTVFTKTSGDIMYGDLAFYSGKSVVLESPNGTQYKIAVANDGKLSATQIT